MENSMTKAEFEKVVSVSSRGQATIPKEFREELGIDTPGRVKFIRTEEGDIVVRPIHSVTDLRGVLEGKTDEQGRSATERLQEERTADKASQLPIAEAMGLSVDSRSADQ
jgi:AbrB family looped-hinge helix DNA binding protein